ncbi:hypothetical protein D3C73_1407600 [compost metagenome]
MTPVVKTWSNRSRYGWSLSSGKALAKGCPITAGVLRHTQRTMSLATSMVISRPVNMAKAIGALLINDFRRCSLFLRSLFSDAVVWYDVLSCVLALLSCALVLSNWPFRSIKRCCIFAKVTLTCSTSAIWAIDAFRNSI